MTGNASGGHRLRAGALAGPIGQLGAAQEPLGGHDVAEVAVERLRRLGSSMQRGARRLRSSRVRTHRRHVAVAPSARGADRLEVEDTSPLLLRDLSLGCFAHDARTPLVASRAAVAWVLDHPDDVDRQRLLEAANRSLEGLGQLLDELLDLDRVGAVSLDRAGRRADVAELAAEVVVRCSRSAQVTVDVLPGVHADVVPTLLRRALCNLLENAFQHGGSHAQLLVRREGGSVLIAVEDDGPGIAAASQDLVFEPFVRLDEDSVEGAGLGLALVRRIVALHGGTVAVVDGTRGGARFEIRLPTADPR